MKAFRRLLAGFLCVLASASAVDWKAQKPQGFLSDFAGVVDPQSKAALEAYAASVQQATGAQLAFVTEPALNGEPIEDVANDLFHAWGIGRKGHDDGALVLLSVAEHKSRLEVGGGLGEAIPDGMAGLLLDDMHPALRQNLYGPALLAAAERLGSTIARAKGVTLNPPAAQYRVPPETRDSIPWSLIFIGLFILMMVIRKGGGGGFWTGMLLSTLLNAAQGGRRGGRDGGGFGGFDSGGSSGGFGGFGGGDSGGGGASSGW